MEESVDREVPMIVIPLFYDQGSNALRVEQKKIGIHLNLLSITETKLLEAIDEMMKPEYKKNIARVREQVYDQPMTSRERAVWWIEFVIRNNGSKHLEYHGRLIPFYQKHGLDFIFIGVLIVLVLAKICLFLLRQFTTSNKEKLKKQ